MQEVYEEEREEEMSDKFTVEPHGEGYALYLGRDIGHHGLNLMNLTEVDPRFDVKHLAKVLNDYAEASELLQKIREGKHSYLEGSQIYADIDKVLKKG